MTAKRKAEKPLQLPSEFDTIALSVKRQLDEHYDRWKTCLQAKQIFSPRSYRIKLIGLNHTNFADEMISRKLLVRLSSPSGVVYYFSGTCPLTEEEMELHTMELDRQREDRTAELRRRNYEKRKKHAQFR